MTPISKLVRTAYGVWRGRVKVDGIVYCGTAENRQHLRGIALGRDEPLTMAAFLNKVRPDDVIFDVGAYLGLFTLRAARATSSHGRVVAFEPDPITAHSLRKSVELNELSERVTLVEAAVAETTGTTTLFRHPTDPSMHSITVERVDSSISVCTVRLEDQPGPRPNVLKVDAEGADLEVLMSLGSHLRNVRSVFVECAIAGSENPGLDLSTFLEKQGFGNIVVFNERGGGVHPWPLDEVDLQVSYVNLYARRS